MNKANSFFNFYTHIDRSDLLISICVFLFLCSVLFFIGGGPVSNDELSYMNLSLFTEAQPTILNRYVHIYMQKLFIWIMNDVFSGAVLMWSFITASCAALVYIGSQTLTKNTSKINGFLALILFLSQPIVFRYVGVTYADYTVMFWVTVATILFVLRLSSQESSWNLYAFLFGLILVLAVKSKETGIILLVLPLIFFSYQSKIGFYKTLPQFLYWIIGGVFGLFIIIALDSVFLNDGFFSLRLSNADTLITYLVGDSERVRGSWVSFLFMSDLALPTLLYALVIIKFTENNNIGTRILYFIPIALLVFLSITMTFGVWNIIPRYVAPIVPCICILASTCLHEYNVDKISIKKLMPPGMIIILVLLIGCAGVCAWYFKSTLSTVPFLAGWTPYTFLLNIYYPLILLSIISLFFFLRLSKIWFSRISIMLIGLGLLPMLVAMPNNLTFSKRLFDNRIYPLKAFEEKMVIDDNSHILVSPSLWKDHEMLSSPGQLIRLFYQVPISSDNVIRAYEWIDQETIDYAIVSTSDLQRWQNDGTAPSATVYKEPLNKVVLICTKKECIN